MDTCRLRTSGVHAHTVYTCVPTSHLTPWQAVIISNANNASANDSIPFLHSNYSPIQLLLDLTICEVDEEGYTSCVSVHIPMHVQRDVRTFVHTDGPRALHM